MKQISAFLFCTFLLSGASTAGPAIATDWTELTMSQERCFTIAEAALARLKFGELERTRYSRYGQHGDYTAVVRCDPELKAVLFVVSGPDRKGAQEQQSELFKAFMAVR